MGVCQVHGSWHRLLGAATKYKGVGEGWEILSLRTTCTNRLRHVVSLWLNPGVVTWGGGPVPARQAARRCDAWARVPPHGTAYCVAVARVVGGAYSQHVQNTPRLMCPTLRPAPHPDHGRSHAQVIPVGCAVKL